MDVLGISCFYHDAAAALYSDGQLVAAAEEERFTRHKHDAGFPAAAARYCLRQAGITARELDYVVFYEKPVVKLERILASVVDTFPGSFSLFHAAMRAWLPHKLWVPSIVRGALGYQGPILYGDHHLSHAASAFLVSPFDRAAVLTVDGVGEWTTAALGVGRDTTVDLQQEIRFPHSLGLLYSALTAFLGFEPNEGEYKVMGMAAYGQPTQCEAIRQLIDARPDGSFRLDMDYFAYHRELRALSARFRELFGEPRAPDAPLTPHYADLAASLQRVVEDTLVGMANHAWAQTRLDALCLAGGVALNGLANTRTLRETPFQRLFIQPAAGDAGSAIGAAASVYHGVLGRPREFVMRHAYWGPEWGESDVRAFLDEHAIEYQALSDAELVRQVAALLARDQVVGWYRGRMEFGPRALGARSILASPRSPRMKDLLNEKIKHREPFRPFAPSVLLEEASRYFDLDCPSPFMLLIAPVRPEQRGVIPAVTHEDGTARLQTVTHEDNGLYYELIQEFRRLTGVPVLVNTSFNVRGEPIVCTPAEAYNCFAHTDMDAVALGNCFVTRKTLLAQYPGEPWRATAEVIV